MKTKEKIDLVIKLKSEIEKEFKEKLIDITPAEAARLIKKPKAEFYQYLKDERKFSYDLLLKYSKIIFK